jgi:hypothetical protein
MRPQRLSALGDDVTGSAAAIARVSELRQQDPRRCATRSVSGMETTLPGATCEETVDNVGNLWQTDREEVQACVDIAVHRLCNKSKRRVVSSRSRARRASSVGRPKVGHSELRPLNVPTARLADREWGRRLGRNGPSVSTVRQPS